MIINLFIHLFTKAHYYLNNLINYKKITIHIQYIIDYYIINNLFHIKYNFNKIIDSHLDINQYNQYFDFNIKYKINLKNKINQLKISNFILNQNKYFHYEHKFKH